MRRWTGSSVGSSGATGAWSSVSPPSPYRTPAAFNIIPYVEARFGGWYVKGGLYEIARALARICREEGVEFRYGQEATARRAAGRWRVASPESAELVDAVVCNQDVLSFLGDEPAMRRRVADGEMSISGFILYLGVGRTYPELSHHNIFFSDDYPEEFRRLFDDRQPAGEPTIYVAVHSKADPGRAPVGCENWFVLVNAPALAPDGRVDWAALAPAYGDRIIDRLETRFGCTGLRAAIRVRRHFTPADFETRYLAHAGSLYGFASHGVRAAFRRPPLRRPGTPDFYFVGGSTHPGGGLPLVCLSGQMVADKVLRRAGGAR